MLAGDFQFFQSEEDVAALRIEFCTQPPPYAEAPNEAATNYTPRNVSFSLGETTWLDYGGRALAVWDRAAGTFRVFSEDLDLQYEAFFAFMKSLRRTSIRTGRRVVVITDNAKYHHAKLHKQWREEHAGDFALDYLPPYSPELSPIERVWKLTRRLCVHNRYFPKLDAVIAAVEAEFDQWTGRNETLRRLCAIT